MARAATTTDAFSAVAEPRRRQILGLLADGEWPVNDLVAQLGLGQPQVSKHLRVLREVGLVSVRDEGRQRLYRLNGTALKPVHDWVKDFERTWNDRFTSWTRSSTSSRRGKTPRATKGTMAMAVATKGSAVVTLPTDTQLKVVREFDAPARLVFRAYTDPDLVKRWWHANRGTVTLAEIDLRVGGKWRWVLRTTGGEDVAFHGEYREIVPGERLVHTELFEMPGITEDDATVNTLVFEEHDGRTTLTTLTDCRTPEILQMIVASGMEAGMQDAYDLLEALAISLA